MFTVVIFLFAGRSASLAQDAAGDKKSVAKEAAKKENAKPAKNKNYKHVVLIRFEGAIESGSLMEQFFYRKLEEAKAEKADLLIIEIESPGGHIEASFNISNALSEIDWAHTVAFVPKGAYSGGTVMAMGCDEIVLGKNAQIGDVGVIFQDKEGEAVRYVPEKDSSPWVQKFRAIAERKGRSPALIESMMRLDTEVFQYTNNKTGEKRYMTLADVKAAGVNDWKQGKLVFESRKKHFLTINGKRGIELGLTNYIGDSRDDVRKIYQIKGPIEVKQWETIDTVVLILNLPVVTGLILLIGLICIYIEFSAPGIGIGGLMAILCFAVFFWSKFLGGTGDWLEVLLFIAGILFILVELFVIPGFGFAGLTGFLLMIVSVVLASHKFTIPNTPQEQSQFLQTLLTITAVGAIFLFAAIMISRYLGKIPMLSKLTLAPPVSSQATDESQPRSATDRLANPPLPVIGDLGTAETALRPSGKASFKGHRMDVVADGNFIEQGGTVEVVEVKGNRIVVVPVEDSHRRV